MNIWTSSFYSPSYRLKDCDYDKYTEIKLTECSVIINKFKVLFEYLDRENYHFLWRKFYEWENELQYTVSSKIARIKYETHSIKVKSSLVPYDVCSPIALLTVLNI